MRRDEASEERGEVLEALRVALSEFESHKEFASLIPQVGTNMVYAASDAKGNQDVAGLSGRIILSLGAPRVCGEVIYGGSHHLASVALEASRLDSRLRAAVNIKGRHHIAEALKGMDLKVITLPPISSEGCPAADYLREKGENYDAYYHPGAHGIEPTISILAENPGKLLKILVGLVHSV